MNDITKIQVNGDPESSYKLFPKNREFEKRAGGNTGSQSVVQSDWNQNDDTQPDYVKNRPFYTGGPVETVLVEESTVSFRDSGQGFYFAVFQSTFEATVGETYKVYWDGAAYECTCVDFSGRTIIGNLSIMGIGPDTGEPFVMNVNNGIGIATTDTSASHTFSISRLVTEVVKIDRKYLPAQFSPEGKSYLAFSSPNNFTLEVDGKTKGWDGTLEYFASDQTWTTWDGVIALSAVYDYGEYVLYLRGTGNTGITSPGHQWVLTGTDIMCIGNIENLLDYATVESGEHPSMADSCYYNMFYGCTSLTQAPELPATTLTSDCYSDMFYGCTSLTQAPALPATTLADGCYTNMFYGCTSLTQAPALPATTLAEGCYTNMFNGCTSLTQAPALPATTLAGHCYSSMFYNCTSLTQAPSLPVTTLADYCYYGMFEKCTSLAKIPALPAPKLVRHCYTCMFQGCTSLKLSSTKTGEYMVAYRIPTTGAGSAAANDVQNMFTSTGGTFTGTPDIGITYYLSTDNMITRETEVATLNGYVGSMIDAAIDEYADAAEYIIPSSTTGSTKKFKITVDDSGTLTTTEVT